MDRMFLISTMQVSTARRTLTTVPLHPARTAARVSTKWPATSAPVQRASWAITALSASATPACFPVKMAARVTFTTEAQRVFVRQRSQVTTACETSASRSRAKTTVPARRGNVSVGPVSLATSAT